MYLSDDITWSQMVGDARRALEAKGRTVKLAPTRKRLRFIVDGWRLMTPDQLVEEADALRRYA